MPFLFKFLSLEYVYLKYKDRSGVLTEYFEVFMMEYTSVLAQLKCRKYIYKISHAFVYDSNCYSSGGGADVVCTH